MIVEVTMYTIACDNCKETRGQDSEYSCWNDENYALDEATDHDWIEHEGKHYCPSCYTQDDNENVVINKERTKTI